MGLLYFAVLCLLTPSYGDNSPNAAAKAATASAVQKEIMQLFVELASGASPEQMEKQVDEMSAKAAAAAAAAHATPKAAEVAARVPMLASIDERGHAALVTSDASLVSLSDASTDETQETPQKSLQTLLEQRSIVRRDDLEDPGSFAEEDASTKFDKSLTRKTKHPHVSTTPVPTPPPTVPLAVQPPTLPPINCEWDRFEPWSECSKSCGGGLKTREREKKRVEQYGGNECEGDDEEEKDCNLDECPILTTPFPMMQAGAVRTHHCSFAGIFVMLVVLRSRA